MPVICEESGRTLIIRVQGEVDHHAARSLMAEISERLDQVLPRNLTMDLGGVSFMDSSGIAVVLRAYRRMGDIRGKMELKNVPPQAGKVLEAAGIDRLISWKK